MALGDPICPRDLACSTARTIILFYEYQGQIGKLNKRTLTEDFFKNFINTWGVARTIYKCERENVRERLIGGDLARLKRGKAGTIDSVAGCYNSNGLSKYVPRSLVSKIGFLAKPAVFVPCDTYSTKGLNLRRDKRRGDGGEQYLKSSYKNYLEVFNHCYCLLRKEIQAECSQGWAKELAYRLNIDKELFRDDAFYRKVLDDVLMTEGGRYPGT